MRTPRREAARSVGLLLAMLAGLMLARWVLADGLSKPLVPATPAAPQVEGTALAGGIPELRGRPLYLGGRQPLVADAGGGPLRPLPIGVAGRTSVLRQGRYLVVRMAEPLQKGPVLALATDRPAMTTPLGSALDVLPRRSPTGFGCSTGGPARRSGPSSSRRSSWRPAGRLPASRCPATPSRSRW